MRTNKLRNLIKTRLDLITELEEVYYKLANTSALFPHAVFNLRSINTMSTDANRKDYVLEIDVWAKGAEADALDICDKIEDALNMANIPFSDIYPTFFFENRTAVEDEDKHINHYLITFSIQLFQ